MSIKSEDISRVNYRPDISWYIDRIYAIADTSDVLYKKYIPSGDVVDPNVLYNKFSDLSKKAKRLEEAIDFFSLNMKIPINKNSQPRLSRSVLLLDQSSQGEYVSYSLYQTLLKQEEDAKTSIDINWLMENKTYDKHSNSDIVYHKYGSTYNKDGFIDENKLNDLSQDGSSILRDISEVAKRDLIVRPVLSFVNEFLAGTNDSRYIPWNFKSDIRRKLVEYDDIGMFLSQYTDLAKDLSKSLDLMPNTPLDLARDFFEALDGKTENDNNFFNEINNILGFNYTADLVCCFSAWAHKIDTKTLKALLMILKLANNSLSIDLGEILNTLMGVINNIFKNIIGPQLIGIIEKIFQLITDPIKRWLNTSDEKWQRIFLCTPIDELVNKYILGGISYLEGKLTDKIIEWIKMIEIDHEFESAKIDIMGSKKELDGLIKLLELIVDSIGKLSQCGIAESPSGDNIHRNIAGQSIFPSWNYTYSKDKNPNKYNSFIKTTSTITKEVDPDSLEESIHETTEDLIIDGIYTNQIIPSASSIDECLKKISDEDVFSVKEWMEDLRAKASEGN